MNKIARYPLNCGASGFFNIKIELKNPANPLRRLRWFVDVFICSTYIGGKLLMKPIVEQNN